MGMFDYIEYKCKCDCGEPLNLQTKDLDCFLEEYRIKNNKLYKLHCDYVQSNERNEWGFPLFKRINQKWKKENLTKSIECYNFCDQCCVWNSFIFRFKNGKLLSKSNFKSRYTK